MSRRTRRWPNAGSRAARHGLLEGAGAPSRILSAIGPRYADGEHVATIDRKNNKRWRGERRGRSQVTLE